MLWVSYGKITKEGIQGMVANPQNREEAVGLDPYPAVFLRYTCLFLPGGHRPHLSSDKFGTLTFPCNATSTRA